MNTANSSPKLSEVVRLFVAQAHKSPIWIAATSLLAASVFWLFVEYPRLDMAELARLESRSNDWKIIAEDNNRWGGALEISQSEFEGAVKFSGRMLEVLSTDLSQIATRANELKEYCRSATERRGRMTALLARFIGMKFQRPEFNDQMQNLRARLENGIEVSRVQEQLCLVVVGGNKKKILEAFAQTQRIQSDQLSSMLTNDEWQKSDLLKFKAMNRELELDTKTSQSRTELHLLLGLLQYPAIVYTIGYIVFILVGLRRTREQMKNAALLIDSSSSGTGIADGLLAHFLAKT